MSPKLTDGDRDREGSNKSYSHKHSNSKHSSSNLQVKITSLLQKSRIEQFTNTVGLKGTGAQEVTLSVRPSLQ